MAYNYVVTAQPATTTLFSVRGNFTGPHDTNLIIGRTTRIEVYQLTADGLTSRLDFSIYGRLASLNLFRAKNYDTELLLFTTEKYQIGVLAYDPVEQKVATIIHGSLRERVGRPVEQGQRILIDPTGRVIASLLYQGMINITPIHQDASIKTTSVASMTLNDMSIDEDKKKDHSNQLLGEACNISLEELLVVDIAFLHTESDQPLLAVLYQDAHFSRHLKTYRINMGEQELVAGPWSCGNVDPGATLLVPVPLPMGGVLILGMTKITYANDNNQHIDSTERVPSNIQCYGLIDANGSRILLGDHYGHLFMLLVISDQNSVVKQLELKPLGQISIPTTVTYLDNRYIYIGSHLGDSQLIRIKSKPSGPDDFLEVMEHYPNIAPITDMCAIQQGLQGQDCVITCSGGFQHGSLRIVRNGVGLTKHALLDLPDITGIWSICSVEEEKWEEMMILSFMNETRILKLDEDQEMAELDTMGDYQFDQPTLYTGNMKGQLLIQVTPYDIQLLTLSEGKRVFKWTPSLSNSSGGGTDTSVIPRITVACGNRSQVVVALAGGLIHYFELKDQTLVEIKTKDLGYEVACLSLQFTDEQTMHQAALLAIGLWTDNSLLVYKLADWQQIAREHLSSSITPRSVLLTWLDGRLYAMVGMGDGQLITMTCHPETGQLTDRVQNTLGTRSIILGSFEASDGARHVFAASDRPAIIYSERQRLVFAGVNLKETKMLCSFHSRAYPNCLAIVNANGIMIGAVDGIRKLHIRSVPLKEMPRRLCYYAEEELLGVLTIRTDPIPRDAMDLENAFVESRDEERSYFRLLDIHTFDMLDQFRMNESELVETISIVKFASQQNQAYFVVGTGITYDGDMHEEHTDGRLLVFSIEDRKKLVLTAELRVPGGVFQLTAFNGLLLACISNRVCLYDLQSNDNTDIKMPMLLKQVTNERLQTNCVRCSIRGDFVAVGDLLRSVALLRYVADQQKFDVLAQDYDTHWISTLTMMNDDVMLAADCCYNLYTLKYRNDEPDEAIRERLEGIGEFHLGDQINRFCSGSLAMWLPDTTNLPSVQLFGTVAGMIGMVIPLTKQQYTLLEQLSRNVNQFIVMPGDIDHSVWRSYQDERQEKEANGVIDGDLVEQFLHLSKQDQLAIIEGRVELSQANSQQQQQQQYSQLSILSNEDSLSLSDQEESGIRPLNASLEEVVSLIETLARWH
ncbi:mono-functional DNA-alkylating methyl methanesulfonate N-term-domain-containing protein [Syncephalis fuscata]|nr:mono-functional DNA-alkylating methyl methanesulfonate N-term-domain-containing protein [Syncephalis fuscata]